MIDFTGLIKKTNAYKIIKRDKEKSALSHAYLIISSDGDNLLTYLKEFAKILCCDEGFPCGSCRACRLIDSEAFSDLLIYPKKGESVLVEDVEELISESYVKPVESQKKVFILNHVETMNANAQNKLLKTLEEPPKNVYILLGATTEHPILSTVKSRVKRIDFNGFSDEELWNALKEECENQEKLEEAIAVSDGTVGKVLSHYGDENLSEALTTACKIITDMKSSRDVLEYSVKVSALKYDFADFLSVLELAFKDLLVANCGKEDLVKNKKLFNNTIKAEGYSLGAIVYAIDKIAEAKKKLSYNGNRGMITEWLLLQILEGKFKWRK